MRKRENKQKNKYLITFIQNYLGSGQESVSPGLTNKYGSLQKNWVIDFAQIKMVEQIGVGRLGEVWKGRWRASPVAVKKLNTQFLTPQQIDELNGSGEFLKNKIV